MKHGFLILLHNNYKQVRKLIGLLDNKNSYIFLHIDKKSNLSDKDVDQFINAAHLAHIIFVDRVSVQWGGYSLVQATLNLLKKADEYDLDYYHLISGADLPLKSWKEFDDYFEKRKGTQFVSYVPEKYQKDLQKRVRYYWLFQEEIGSPKKAIQQKDIYRIFLLAIQRAFVFIQKVLGVDRRKKNRKISFRIGSEWISITREFLSYVVCKEQWIKETFKDTVCPDEVFMTTLLSNSRFSDKVLENQRYIDWGRGNPYVFREVDYNELLVCEKMFARKFDETVDPQIVDKIYTSIHNLNMTEG